MEDRELEKEFEARKAIHLFNTVQLFLTIQYFNQARQQESIVPTEILQTAIAHQVVNDMESIICQDKLQDMYKLADDFLVRNNLDIDEFTMLK